MVHTVKSPYRRQGKGLFLLKFISHFFPRCSEVWFQNLLDVVCNRHLQILQLKESTAEKDKKVQW